MKCISVRIATRGARATNGSRRHDEQIGKQPAHIDGHKIHHNSIILPTPAAAAMAKECQRRRVDNFVPGPGKRRPVALKSDAVVSISGIVTLSKEAQPIIDKLPKSEQDRRFKQTGLQAEFRRDQDDYEGPSFG
jgi:hypothetical protein